MASPKPFNSELVISEKISESDFRAYHVGFDQNRFRLKELVNVIVKVLPEFALGYHEGKDVPMTEMVDKLREAANTIYTTEKFGKRGEFGELVLHLLLRDFCDTIPLVAKIYFKDTANAAVHGFDGVHITTGDAKKLWLGESKFYTNGLDGMAALCNDLKEHLKEDYLRSEFSLLKRKLPKETPEISHWRNLMEENQKLETIFSGICIPMVCTYTSEIFGSHTAETAEYLKAFEEECRKMKKEFDSKKIATSVDVLLMLLPIPDKNQLAKELDERLKSMQNI